MHIPGTGGYHDCGWSPALARQSCSARHYIRFSYLLNLYLRGNKDVLNEA